MTLDIDAADADASGYEPIWKDKKRIGFVTSGGYGHTIGQVPGPSSWSITEYMFTGERTVLSVHVVGSGTFGHDHCAASPYDPEGLCDARWLRQNESGAVWAMIGCLALGKRVQLSCVTRPPEIAWFESLAAGPANGF